MAPELETIRPLMLAMLARDRTRRMGIEAAERELDALICRMVGREVVISAKAETKVADYAERGRLSQAGNARHQTATAAETRHSLRAE